MQQVLPRADLSTYASPNSNFRTFSLFGSVSSPNDIAGELVQNFARVSNILFIFFQIKSQRVSSFRSKC